MSTVKANNVQVGQSGTATNNFTLYQPSTPDGTVRLAVGNSGATTGDVLSVSSTGLSVTGTLTSTGVNTFPAGSASAPSITTTGDTNTGVFFPAADTVGVATGGSERMRIDSLGNVGIGVTPSVWYTTGGYHALQVGNTSLFGRDGTNSELYLNANAYDNSSGNATYISSDYASRYNQNDGAHTWYTAPSGTAGSAITFTERMRITSSGLVNIGGGGNIGVLNVRQATNVNICTTVGGNDATAIKLSCINDSAGANIPLVLEGTYISFEKGGNSQSGRFDTNGYFLLGYTSSNGAYRLQVNSQIFATSATIATSDGRYKENVTPLTGALDIVKALNPVQFQWKQHPVHNFDRSCPTVGFIAQEVQQVLADKPYLNSIIKANECTIQEEVKDEEGNVVTPAVKEDFYGIAEGNMIAILTKALQEAIGEIETLKTKVAALEAKGA